MMPRRDLNALVPDFRVKVFELLARATEAGVPVLIINTLRTDAEQAEAIRTGHSKVLRSKHQDGLAIDICPYEVFQMHGPDKLAWVAPSDTWRTLGRIGEALGLRWGGRFTPLGRDGIGWDPGHFEYVPAVDRSLEA